MQAYDVVTYVSTAFLVVGIVIVCYSFNATKGNTIPWLHSESNRLVMIVGIIVACLGQVLANILRLIAGA